MIKNMTNYYVYGHYRKDNNELFYVGKGKDRRAWSKKNRNKYWKNIVNKVGYEIRFFHINCTEIQAFELEVHIISQMKPIANYTVGGEGGNTFVKKTKEEIKQIMDKRNFNPKLCASYGFKGKKHTEERNQLMSEKHKGKQFRPFTEEDRLRLLEAAKIKSCPVVDCLTGIIYPSIREASRQTGIWVTNIHRFINKNKRFFKITK